MRNKIGLVGMLLFTASLALVACAPGGGSGPSSDQEPAQDIETPVIAEETETPMTDSESQEMVLYVGPVLVDCEGEGPQKCMLVKEDPDGEYGLFYDQIEGFEHEKGFEYQLLVSTEPVEDPPAGASSIKWTLVEVVDKQLSLEGNLWGLESYAGNDSQMVDVIPGSEVTAEFVDGQINGSAGCNNYFGSYELSGNSLTMAGPFGITEMFCASPPGVMEQESQYMVTIQDAASYVIEGDQLQISNTDGETILVYTLVQPTSLEGTSWLMLSYNNGKGGLASTLLDTEITAEFMDGTVSGSAGCNNYHASYELDGNHISFGPAATTRMFCAEPEGVMEQENQYLAALQSVATYEIKADALEMFDADGTRMVTYQAAAIGEATDAPPAPDEVLANTEYQSEWTESGTAPLVDGEYREQAAPGSASEIVVRLTEHVAYGQLSDGREAAAVILVTETGGSGTFYDLAVVVEEDGQPVNVATTFLGDRVKIENLVFIGGEILVEMVNQGPEDPMCCPTQRVVQTYELQGEELVQTSSRIVGTEGSTGDGG
jgi:heat shock protein HslJ